MSSPVTEPAARTAHRSRGGRGPLAAARRLATGMPGQVLLNTAAFTLPEELRMGSDWRVLDIACGRAGMIRVLADRVGVLDPPIGIDTSQTLLADARRDMATQGGPPVGLARGRAQALPFADESFHLAVSAHAFRHLGDDELLACMKEARRVLKLGGLFLAWEFGQTKSRLLDRWNRWVLTRDERGIRLRGYRELRDLALEAGFDWIDDARLRPFILPPIPRVSIIMGKAPAGWRRTMVGGRPTLEYAAEEDRTSEQ